MNRALAALSAAALLASLPILASASDAAPSGHRAAGMTVTATGTSTMQATAQGAGGVADVEGPGQVSHDGDYVNEALAMSAGSGGTATADVAQDNTVTDTDVHLGATSTGSPNGGTVSVTNRVSVSFTPSRTGTWQITLDGQNNGSTAQGCLSSLTVSFTLLDQHQVPCNGGVFLLQKNLKLVGGVTYTLAGGHDASSLDGSAFVALEVKYLAPPVSTKLPVISGQAVVGKTLKTTKGSWRNAPTKFASQWLRSGKTIAGATAASYKLTGKDVGKKISVTVTASNSGGKASAASKPTGAVRR